jgi:DUF4097 and DUF4098 domain-containing protein YvlB
MYRSRAFVRSRFLFVFLAFSSLAGATAGHAVEQRHESTRSFDRTIAVTSGQTLRLENRHGDVRLTTHARPDLRIQAAIRVSAPSQAEAAEFVDRIDIEVVEAPSGVTVRTRYPERTRGMRRNVSYSVDYTVVMPERMPLHARNSFGHVSVAGLKSDSTVINAHGTLTASDGAGRQSLENSFGAIEVARMAGDVTITGGNGSVTAASIGGALNVTNRFGRVSVGKVQGPAVVANANGQVDVTDVGSATVTNSFGAVTIRDVRGPLTVTNPNGSVTAGGVSGAAKIAGSFGAIDVKDVRADATIENSNGGVKLANVRGTATVRTSFAPAEIIGVGGPVTVTNSNGSVLLRDVGGPAEVRGSFGRIDAEELKSGIRITSGNSGVRVLNVRGPVAITTTFGPVELRNVDGKVDVRNQNGAIDASAVARPGACHDIALATTFSYLQVQLPNAGYAVTAQTSFGTIRSDVPITATGTMGGEGRLSGTIGGGGCALQLTNSNGDIRIVKSGTAP